MASLQDEATCIICLCSIEDGEGPLLENKSCTCSYSYHAKCMKDVKVCPLCNKEREEVSRSSLDDRVFKAIVFIIIISVLAAAGYFSARV